ncbi:MAG: DMT family transporter [Pseudomonadota bacterium]
MASLLFAMLIAGSFSIGHMAAPHIESTALNAVRFAFATVLMALVLIITTPRSLAPPEAPWRFLILGGLMASYFILMFVALRFSTPVSTGAVFTLIPLMSAGFGWIVLAQITRSIVLASLLIAAAGAVWVIFRGDLQALLGFDIGKGEMIFFVGCICHALYGPMVKRLNRGEPILIFTLYTLAATTFCIVIFGFNTILSTDWMALPAIVWIAIVYLAIFTTAITFFLVQYASMRLPASKFMAYSYLTPTFVILLEGLLGHGWASLSIFAGAMITVIGLVIMVLAPDG